MLGLSLGDIYMNFKKFGSQMGLVGVCLSLLFLSGCAHYRAKPLQKLPVTTRQSPEQTVSFEYHVLDRRDCKQYLDRNVQAKGYQPIQLTIENNSSRSLYFSLSSFDIPCIDADDVASTVHTSTVGRAVGYTVAGLVSCIWLLFIPAIVDGIGSDKANEQLDIDFARKAVHNQIIAPNSTVNGLIFVPYENFNDDFSFSLADHEKNEHFKLSTIKRSVKI
jgi:hypothetical protein